MKFNHPYYRLRAEKWERMRNEGMTLDAIARRELRIPQTIRIAIRRLQEGRANG